MATEITSESQNQLRNRLDELESSIDADHTAVLDQVESAYRAGATIRRLTESWKDAHADFIAEAVRNRDATNDE